MSTVRDLLSGHILPRYIEQVDKILTRYGNPSLYKLAKKCNLKPEHCVMQIFGLKRTNNKMNVIIYKKKIMNIPNKKDKYFYIWRGND